MEKEANTLFSLTFLLILLGSPSYMVLGQVQKCKVAQACDPASCKHGIILRMEGKCICDEPPMHLKSDVSLRQNIVNYSCKVDSDCANKCPPVCQANCFHGVCFCKGSDCGPPSQN
ncbi:unnamed protein product [Withania somnifera]